MKINKKTVLNILLIAFVLSFFVTPLGHYGKILLNQLFSFPPDVIKKENRIALSDYQWTLKDQNWDFFNFEEAKGKVVFINFWASWRLPCEAELKSVQKLYDLFKDKVVFYIITDEEREPVEVFMEKHGFTFPVTYLVIGENAPIDIPEPPASYILDREGKIVVSKKGIADWDNKQITNLLNKLLANE